MHANEMAVPAISSCLRSLFIKQHVCDLATALQCRAVFIEKKRRARWRTSVCLNLAMVFERADEVILPAVYSFVARSFSATPSDLANITLARALVQAVCSRWGACLVRYKPAEADPNAAQACRRGSRMSHVCI